MKLLRTTSLLLALAALPALASARNVTDPERPRALPAEGQVAVAWTDPSAFSELRFSGNRWEAAQGDWVTQLAEHLRKEAGERLAPGQSMEVTITDIQRAGRFEPGLGFRWDSVRIMRDIYPPRMTLDVRITGADGQVLAQGQHKLADTSYLMTSSLLGNTDPLRYEKRMIDDWLRRELPAQRNLAASP